MSLALDCLAAHVSGASWGPSRSLALHHSNADTNSCRFEYPNMPSVPRTVTPTNDASTRDPSPSIVPNDTAAGSSLGADTEIVDLLLSDTEGSGNLAADDLQSAVDPMAQTPPLEDPPATQERPPESQASGDVTPPTPRSRSSSMDEDSRTPSPVAEPPWFARFRHRSLTGLCSTFPQPRYHADNSY